MEAEKKVAAQTNKTARVKIEKGHAWLIRILPFPQGPARKPLVQLAQHWINKRSVYCKTNTSPDFGGDSSYDCPICATAAACKNDAQNDDERDDFYQIEARIQYRCYCLVVKKDDGKSIEEMSGEDLLVPYEFFLPKSSFTALLAKIERSKARKGASPRGLLDLETGTDIWAIRDNKNSLTFDLSEDGPQPIFTQDEYYDDKINRVWKQLKQPNVKFLADDRMEAIADMVAERAFEKASKSLANDQEGGRGGSSRGGNGARGRFHEADEEPSPRGRARSNAEEDVPQRPARSEGRSSSFARAQAAIGGDDDQIPGAEVPPRPARRAAPAQSEDTGAEQPAEEAPKSRQPQQEAEEAPRVTSSRGGAAARPTAAPGRVAVPPGVAAGRRASDPVPPPTRRSEGRVEDEGPGEGDPAPEDRDLAPAEPAAKEPVADAPPRPAPARSSLQGALKSSVANLASRGR